MQRLSTGKLLSRYYSCTIVAIVEHAWENGHPIKWEEASVVDHARRSGELLVKEALHIRLTSRDELFNRDDGLELPKFWVASIGKRTEAL